MALDLHRQPGMARIRSALLVLALAIGALAPVHAEAQRLGAVSAAVHGGGGSHGGGSFGGGGYRGGGRGYGYGNGGYGWSMGQRAPWVSLYYPYYFGYGGTMVRRDALTRDRTFDGPDVIGIVDASAGYVLDGVVRGQISARVRLANILDVEARYGAYFEMTDDVIRELGLGRLAALFPVVSEGEVQMRAGVLGLVYHDAAGPELGYGGALELDVYPVSPLVIRAEASAGVVGQAVFVDARATVGMQIDRGELYVGWQVFAVNPFDPGGATLHGPVAGVRVWIS